MTVKQRVQQAKGPADAMLAIAEALDELLALAKVKPEAGDSWGSWDVESTAEPAYTIERGENSSVIDIKPVSGEQKAARMGFAEKHLRLQDAFPGIGAVDAYVKGGPVWLVDFDRDYVLSLPFPTRQMLVADVNLIDPQTAAEMGRDILMERGAGDLPSAGGEWV